MPTGGYFNQEPSLNHNQPEQVVKLLIYMSHSLHTGVVYKQGKYKEALEDILHVIGIGLCPQCGCEGCKYEVDHAIQIAKAVLGQPIDRQKCLSCGALDQIYWSKEDDVPNREMSCHNCGTIEPKFEWIQEVADVSTDR